MRHAVDEPAASDIEARFRRASTRSAQLVERARNVMPGGSTRTFGCHQPYPVVFARGEGSHLVDVDGRRYVDLTYNGLSLIHGHAYPPVLGAIATEMAKGTAWPGASIAQIEFAEVLTARIATADLVRFTNTGTEATMTAVKVARHVTGRPLVIKSIGAYHGSYDDLEAGLHGIGELQGRTRLAEFGDLGSYERIFAECGDQVAAVVIEPILYTYRVVTPPPGFLAGLAEMAKRFGAVVILDDCLMFRLAKGGSAEKYGFEPDLTCLGKFIGGGLPVGVVAGREELMSVFDPARENTLYHGGSFNGNPLGCAAGKVTLEHLTPARIAVMDAQAASIADGIRGSAAALGLPCHVTGDGSVLGMHIAGPDGHVDREAGVLLQLAAMEHGVYFGQDGELAMATTVSDSIVGEIVDGVDAAMKDLAAWMASSGRLA